MIDLDKFEKRINRMAYEKGRAGREVEYWKGVATANGKTNLRDTVFEILSANRTSEIIHSNFPSANCKTGLIDFEDLLNLLPVKPTVRKT